MSLAQDHGIALHASQRRAIAHIKAQAISLRLAAVDVLSEIFSMSNIPISSLDLVRSAIRQHARVALHFHPDRPVGNRVVAQGLLEDGTYRSQFETGISNGSVSAHAGGFRDLWERSLFQGAYHADDVSPCHRPRYGALNLMRNPEGPAPRFGSCYLVLKPEVSARSTFTFGGSQADPRYRGIVDEFDAVLSALFEECFTRDFALGVSGIRPPQLMARILDLHEPLPANVSNGVQCHNLDHFIEAQVHGDVHLDRDVEALIVDPSFRGSEIWQYIKGMATKYRFPLHCHHGFSMRVQDVPIDFRGPSMPSLAAAIARNGHQLDAETIGRAVRELARHPESWSSRGTYAEVLQEMKLIWHVLVRFGWPYG
ncbi:uncharacterized protein Z520_02168 [Fonsecaea multimorphosa CBS 102226]|uniref:DUF3626 domain-containing protein n=1 Tax=Fonsecaea multimorphosa CBS 102226 TaxID=1442371 RepID=A0A0D2KF59_9EURO|nr:uncharacterized protein Z520_02168 [Fonsecaea multimorphosa CBS 102226]KIY02030.1 hypothetical protein Z520_02168 [Fonsecaea multimorphosa CBS 102226]OAL29230.1 hypothetical protein AYO22_02124 [Fonsecaea multimorphosa]